MWAILEGVLALLQLLALLPAPKPGQTPPKPGQSWRDIKPLPGWLRWPIYGVIVLGVLFLVFSWVIVRMV